VGKMGESMKAMELAVVRVDCCCVGRKGSV